MFCPTVSYFCLFPVSSYEWNNLCLVPFGQGKFQSCVTRPNNRSSSNGHLSFGLCKWQWAKFLWLFSYKVPVTNQEARFCYLALISVFCPACGNLYVRVLNILYSYNPTVCFSFLTHLGLPFSDTHYDYFYTPCSVCLCLYWRAQCTQLSHTPFCFFALLSSLSSLPPSFIHVSYLDFCFQCSPPTPCTHTPVLCAGLH